MREKEGGERWRDKQRGVSSFCSEYIFAVSCWRRSCRRQKAQFFCSRTKKTGVHSSPRPQPLSVGWAGETEPERSFVLADAYKGIKASSILLIFPRILLQTMLRDSDGAVSLCQNAVQGFYFQVWELFRLAAIWCRIVFLIQVWLVVWAKSKSVKEQKTNSTKCFKKVF